VIIGGLGNHRGAILGAILVPVAFEEATRYIPPVAGNPNLIPALQWVVIGCLILLFLWFRPQGILPERRRKLSTRPLPDETTTGNAAEPRALPGTTAARDGVTASSAAAPAPGTGPSMLGANGSAEAADVILQCRDLTRTFQGVPAVDGVSMAFDRARLTGIIGPNGAGKSTVLAMLAGTLSATSGQVLLRGEDVTELPAYRRARHGLVRTFQLASEFKRLTVLENLLSAVPRHRGDSLRGAVRGRRYWRADEAAAIARAQALLRRFGLAELADRYAGELSGGQRRLVEIMRALMTEPSMLLLDEPMAGVHPDLARRIGRELVALCGDGMTVLMVEHELAIMDEFCDPVIVMAEGSVLATGTMADLRARSEVVEAYLVG
jgi:branched-chain amino acid transport system permease protein